jgi:two-component system sensor histidine kinase YesM
MIYRIGIFLENETIISNQAFRVVDEKTAESEWYQRACEANGKVIWDYLPYLKSGQEKSGLALARMLHSKKGENVGVLAIYLQQEWLDHLLQNRNGESYLFLNAEEVVSSAGDEELNVDEVRQLLADADTEEYQTQVKINGEEFILTCVKAVQDHVEDQLSIVSVRRVSEILKEDQEQNRRSLAFLFGSYAAILCLIALFAWSYNRKVEKFKSQMQKASEGNFELVEHIGGTDEISQLYEYLNTMILQIRQLLAEVYREKIHAEQLKNKQKDAEFKMLTSQINPHFLYNTLETIRMKARINQQYEIEDLVKMLGKLLRSSIQAGVEETTIGEEVELVECYLKIQQYRFGQRLNYRIEVEEGLDKQPILPLVLQPMAENAIIHGLEEKMDDGHMEITITRYDDEIRMVIEDDGPGIPADKLAEIREDLKSRRVKGRHIGISNVHQRLVMRYGEAYGVSIESEAGGKTRVILRLPYQKNE